MENIDQQDQQQQYPADDMQETYAEDIEEVTEEPDWDEEEQETGLKINWGVLGMVVLYLAYAKYGHKDLSMYLYLAIVVLFHELGHVIAGLIFKCRIKSMQVFFLPAISYRHTLDDGANAWSRIKWSIGVLPFGGVTMFDESNNDTGEYGMLDRPMWQQFIISSAGIVMNLILLGVCYIAATSSWLSSGMSFHMLVMARMSLILAVLNIIPLYPLDGGAMLMQVIQMVTGHRFSRKTLGIFSQVGFLIIIVFFFFVTGWMDKLFLTVFNIVGV